MGSIKISSHYASTGDMLNSPPSWDVTITGKLGVHFNVTPPHCFDSEDTRMDMLM